MSDLPCIPPIIDRRNRGLDGYQQFRLAREKIRLDLFDKRFAVFFSAVVMLSMENSSTHGPDYGDIIFFQYSALSF